MKTFRYSINGTAADDQTWSTDGTVTVSHTVDIFDAVMRDSFERLTGGKAQYGLPGVGCAGPYDIKRVLIERREDA